MYRLCLRVTGTCTFCKHSEGTSTPQGQSSRPEPKKEAMKTRSSLRSLSRDPVQVYGLYWTQ